jgi:uncharacterized protein (TIGR02246 family)
VTLNASDLVAIQQLVSRYNQAVDSGDGAAFAGVFTDDGALVTPVRTIAGHEELEAFPPTFANTVSAPRHITTNMIIDGEGDKATIKAYVQVFTLQGDPPSQQVSTCGRYEDSLVRTNGEWRFTERIFSSDI